MILLHIFFFFFLVKDRLISPFPAMFLIAFLLRATVIQNTYASVAVYQKYLTRLGEFTIFEPCTYSIYRCLSSSMDYYLLFLTPTTHEFSTTVVYVYGNVKAVQKMS